MDMNGVLSDAFDEEARCLRTTPVAYVGPDVVPTGEANGIFSDAFDPDADALRVVVV